MQAFDDVTQCADDQVALNLVLKRMNLNGDPFWRDSIGRFF